MGGIAKANIPVSAIGLLPVTFQQAGMDISTIYVIYEIGNPMRSYKPGRAINSIVSIVPGKGYYLIAKVDIDFGDVLLTGYAPSNGIGAMAVGSTLVIN